MSTTDELVLQQPLEIEPEGEAAAPRPATGLRRRIVGATMWSIVRMGGSRAISLGSNLVMTRLLFPEAFGLMVLVNVCLRGMHLMSDMGLGPSIIQNEKGTEPRFLNTAWVLQIIRGTIIWAVAAGLAWPLSVFYGQPELYGLITVAGLTAFIAGLESTGQYTLRRQLRPRNLAIMEFAAQATTVSTMIVWAVISPTVWVLVGGPVAGALVRAVWSHFLLGEGRNRLQWDRDSARAVFHFGKWIFLSSGLYFLAGQLDRLMLPAFIPFEVLGVYGIAVLLASVPQEAVHFLSFEVIFPALSELNQLPRQQLRAKILPSRGKFLILLGTGMGLMAGSGDLIVRLLYDSRYHEAGWMLIVLVIGLWPAVMIETINPALLAVGKPRYFAYTSAARAFAIGIGVPLGYSFGGLPGVVVVVALCNLVEYAVSAYGLWRNQLWMVWQDIRMTALWLAVFGTVVGLRIVLPWSWLKWH